MRSLLAFAAATALLLGTGFAGAEAPKSGHTHSRPDPATMGGTYALRDIAGRTVTSDSLKGRWTLFYFGYSRCTDTCPLALPTIVEAARTLNQRGIPARAVFVDIEPPSGTITPRNPAIAPTQHGHHGASNDGSAMAEIAQRFAGGLLVLTGSRSQLNAATVAFQVRREHTPPRPLEKGHSINHTSFIYIASPTGAVTGYLPYDIAPANVVRAVRDKASGS